MLWQQKMKIMLQDIMQGYTQSKTKLNCTVICHLSIELKKRYLGDTILLVVKLLYGLAKARNHWYAIYIDHYKEKLRVKISLYNACFLITQDNDKNFGIAGLQTDNIFNVGTEAFIINEETEIMKAKFTAKTLNTLETCALRDFNVCHITIKSRSIMIG